MSRSYRWFCSQITHPYSNTAVDLALVGLRGAHHRPAGGHKHKHSTETCDGTSPRLWKLIRLRAAYCFHSQILDTALFQVLYHQTQLGKTTSSGWSLHILKTSLEQRMRFRTSIKGNISSDLLTSSNKEMSGYRWLSVVSDREMKRRCTLLAKG